MVEIRWRENYKFFQPTYNLRTKILSWQFNKYPIMSNLKDDNMWVHFVDNRKWSSNIVITTKTKTIVVDISYTAGGRVALDYLKTIGIKTIDLLVFTHPHQDHMNRSEGFSYHTPNMGIRDYLDYFDIKEIWYNGDKISNTNENGQIVLTAVLNQIFPDGYTEHDESPTYRGVPVTTYHEPKCIDAPYVRNFDEIELRVIHPDAVMTTNVNANSIVIKVVFGNTAFMLTGDAVIQSENKIIEKVQRGILDLETDIEADVLYLGHHALYSTCEAWLDAVNPKYVTAQTSAVGYPEPRILAMLEDESRGIHFYHPFADKTTYIFQSNGNEVTLLPIVMYNWKDIVFD